MYSGNSVFQGGEDPVGLLELYLGKVNPKFKAFSKRLGMISILRTKFGMRTGLLA